jgi:diaminopimelate decarboxylase
MTLADILPTLRSSLPHPIEPWLWPSTTHHIPGGDLAVSGVSLVEAATRYGTPCLLLDTAEFRQRCAMYRRAFHDAEVAYAAKALLTRAVARIVGEEGLWLDVCSLGELTVARQAGVLPERMILHGNGKSTEFLEQAVDSGVGRVVVDSIDELVTLAAVARGRRQPILLRVVPGVDAHTHQAVTTGTEGQKFGISPAGGGLDDAVARALAAPSLELVGLHCHIGSQVTGTGPYEAAATRMVQLLADVRDRHGVVLTELNLGGGHAIAYHAGDVPLAPGEVAGAIRRTVARACAEHDFPAPRLTVEPGRAIAGPCGVTLYRVVTVKRSGDRTWVTVDGGMSDNLRPALYGARYTARLVGRLSGAAEEHMSVAGQHREAGDVLVEDVLVPGDVRAGDLLAVPASGAYHFPMASNYNLTPRLPLVGVENGDTRTLVRRETILDLLRRDLG